LSRQVSHLQHQPACDERSQLQGKRDMSLPSAIEPNPRAEQEIWPNAHETRDSSSLISYAGCLGLSPVISAKIHSLNARRSLKSRKNSLKPLIFGAQGRSRSSMFVHTESSSAVTVMICSKSVSICNRSHA